MLAWSRMPAGVRYRVVMSDQAFDRGGEDGRRLPAGSLSGVAEDCLTREYK